MEHWSTSRARRQRLALALVRGRPLMPPVYTVHPEMMMETTAWVLTSTRPPPVCGWWKCRTIRAPAQGGPSVAGRRFWNGSYFSAPVHEGDSDECTEDLMRQRSIVPADRIVWCGLPAPHPGRYPYRLYATGTNLDPLKER